MASRFSIVLLLLFTTVLAWGSTHELPRHRSYTWSGLALEDLQGNICVPVVFVNFAAGNNDNETQVSTGNQDLWMTRLNDKCTANHMGEEGSVNDYFRAQSYGLMNVTFENIGTYTAEGKGANYQDYAACAQLLRKAVASFTGVDWSRYDSNGDHVVDCVLAIYAGHCDDDQSSRRATIHSIYPHQNWLSSIDHAREAVGEGYEVESYVFANDLRDRSTGLAAINTVCHELSHGIFDLCDYYKSLTSYMGQYDAMCYGYRQTSYGASNDHCCDYTAFNRMYLGWLTPEELTEPCHVRLEPLSKAAEAKVIFDPQDASHFYLLENRAVRPDTWDAHLPAGGLVLVEVRWRRDAFEYHSVNSGVRKNIRAVCAATGQGLALANDSYYDFDQRQVPYGVDGRDCIDAAVNEVFATQTVSNIVVNADQSVEFDYMGGQQAIDQVEADQTLTPCHDLMGRRVAPGGLSIRNGRIEIVK